MELELERDSGAFVNKRTGKLVRQKFKILDENNPIRRYAPEDQYDSEKIRTPIELVANRARFLDEKNRPQLMFIAFAFPPQSLTQNPLNVLDENLQPEYDLRYTMLVRDADLDNPERYFAKPIGNLDNTAIFILPHKKEHTHFTIAAESIRTTAGAQKYDYKDPLKIGQVFFDKVETLKPDPKKLEVSDLVLGVAPPDSFDSRLLPFPLIPTRRIWQQDLLKVYFEVYHLQLGKDGIGKFTVDSRIIRLKKKGKKFSRQELVATTFEFSSHSMTSKENFGVSIAHYKPGNYELEVEVADRVSGKKKKTSAAFEIVR